MRTSGRIGMLTVQLWHRGRVSPSAKKVISLCCIAAPKLSQLASIRAEDSARGDELDSH